jgi:phosphoribosylamine--glycine ligase
MRVLLVGSGGREHALAWKIAQSPLLEHLWAAPGNPGIARHARCLDLAPDDGDGLAGFATGHGVDLVVVGPEAPLVAGLADRLRAAGLTVFGPGAAAAAIEGSKAFSKALMARQGVPTARFATFDDPAAARRFCRDLGAAFPPRTTPCSTTRSSRSTTCATAARRS